MLERLLKQKAIISVLLFGIIIGGVVAYMNIGKLEDAEVPMKLAMVITPYPGASAHDVELEVSDPLERAIERLENIKEIESISIPGMSLITIEIEHSVRTSEMPQLWDHLRRKVGDANLPKGAYAPIINDDFSDTYGMLYSVTSDGYSSSELKRYSEFIERELLAVDGVRRSQMFGLQTETIEIIFDQDQLAKLSINPMMIALELKNQSEVVNSGSLTVGREQIRVAEGAKIGSIEQVENLLIKIPRGGTIRLGDIADIEKSLLSPKRGSHFYNGKQAIALGISNESGVNVVKLGDRLKAKISELTTELPKGINIEPIYLQSERVDVAVKGFVTNLIISILIVMVVLLFAMGMRSGLLISSGLMFTILGTLIIMWGIDLPLHRVTLGAIILAMGMLVDNSIVVADGILVDLKRGVDRDKAFVATAKKTALPLLAATLVAIIAFMPLGLSKSMAGEMMVSLFIVLIISLFLSWIFAMVQTPFMAKFFYRKERPSNETTDHLDKGIYKYFGYLVKWSIINKKLFVSLSTGLLVVGVYLLSSVNFNFMSSSEYDQILVEYKLPQGSNIDAVEDDLKDLDKAIREIDGVKFVAASIGRPPVRYLLMRPMNKGGSNYGELIIEAESIEQANQIADSLKVMLPKIKPEAMIKVLRYSPMFSDYHIEAQFSGPDPAVLRELSSKAEAIMREHPETENVCNSWENQSKVVSPRFSVDRGQKLGVTRANMANSIKVSTEGMPIGAIYEGKNMIPIILKSRSNSDDLNSIPVWGDRSMNSIPLGQIVDGVDIEWEDQKVVRHNGQRAIRAQCNVNSNFTPKEIQLKMTDNINSIECPKGYSLKWFGSMESADEANGSIMAGLPIAMFLIVIIIIALFNNLKQSLIIFSVVPYVYVGIAFGFKLTGSWFDFLCIIGSLGLIGMMIKNAVVLMDEINIGIRDGKSRAVAAYEASLSRMRPIMMASLTTILGMIPLLYDKMFGPMAVTIMSGLFLGSIITLLLVPVLYALLFKVDISGLKKK